MVDLHDINNALRFYMRYDVARLRAETACAEWLATRKDAPDEVINEAWDEMKTSLRDLEAIIDA
jgi:hypothetical protein